MAAPVSTESGRVTQRKQAISANVVVRYVTAEATANPVEPNGGINARSRTTQTMRPTPTAHELRPGRRRL